MEQKTKKVTWKEFKEDTLIRVGIMFGYFIGGLFLFGFGIIHKDVSELIISNLLFVGVLFAFWLINIQYKKYKNKI